MKLTVSKSENRSDFYRIVFFLGIILFVLLFKNIFIPLFSDVLDSIGQYSSMSERWETLSDWKTKNIELKKQINFLTAKLENASVALVKSSQTSSTLNALDSLSNSCGVRISKMEFENLSPKGSYNELSTILTVEGSYLEISDFVKLIETKNILLNVNSFDMKINSLYSHEITTQLMVRLLFRR